MDITKGTSNNNGKSPSKVSTSGSAFSKTILGFRPRATTADSGSYSRPRPRATTVSHGTSNGNSSVGMLKIEIMGHICQSKNCIYN